MNNRPLHRPGLAQQLAAVPDLTPKGPPRESAAKPLLDELFERFQEEQTDNGVVLELAAGLILAVAVNASVPPLSICDTVKGIVERSTFEVTDSPQD